MSKAYVINVGDHYRGEVTNVGVIVFDAEGNRHGVKMATSLDRAISRGDWKKGRSMGIDDIREWAERFESLKDVERQAESIGAAMSSIQIRHASTTIQENIDHFLEEEFKRLVVVDS